MDSSTREEINTHVQSGANIKASVYTEQSPPPLEATSKCAQQQPAIEQHIKSESQQHDVQLASPSSEAKQSGNKA